MKFISRAYYPLALYSYHTATISSTYYALCSLQALHNKLIASEVSQEDTNGETAETFWQSDDEIVNAVWTLVRVSASDEADSMRLLVSDFLSRVTVIRLWSVSLAI